MTGDQDEILSRIKALLPARWFGDTSPVLDSVLSCFSWSLAFVYSLIQYAKDQTRIATATNGFLDLISYDFFGSNLPRRQQELDDPFRTRILSALLREKVTRNGIIAAMVSLTGRTPLIFEPARPADTGGLGLTLGLGVAGGVGSLLHRAQAFMTAFRPAGSGIPFVPGLGTNPCGLGIAGGAIVASLSWVQGYVTDTDIYAAAAAAKPEGTIVWMKLSN